MICNYCQESTIKHLISETNSTYTYCSNCKDNYDTAYKHIAIDAVLKKLVEFLEISNSPKLKIEVKKENDLILLIINNIRVFETSFKNDFIKEDIYYLENVIYELTQDYYKFNLSNVDIRVCE